MAGRFELVLAATLGMGAAAAAQAESEWLPLPNGPVHRVAFGSCAKHWQPQPIWDAIIARNPDFFIFAGDNIYADTDGKTAWLVNKGQLTGEWNRLADKPEFQRARAAMPFLAIWDNHDYGSHAGGGEFPVKQESKECFLTFFGEPKDSPRWQRSGIYDSKIIGPEGKRLQVILLDTKFNRSAFRKDPAPKEERLKVGKVGGYLPDDDPAKTHLGEEQWKWLEAELKRPADLRLLVSSIQVVPNQKGMDEWGNFPLQRDRLLKAVSSTNNTIVLSGNVHFAEVSHDPESGVTEFTSSGFTHIEEAYAAAPNRFRIGEPAPVLNFGLLQIDWSKRQVDLEAFGVRGDPLFNHLVSFEGKPVPSRSDP